MAFTRFELCLSSWRLHDAQARPQLTVSRQNHNLIVMGQAFGARVSVRICLRWCTWLYRWYDSLLQQLHKPVDSGSPKCLTPPGSSEMNLKDLTAGCHSKSTSHGLVEA